MGNPRTSIVQEERAAKGYVRMMRRTASQRRTSSIYRRGDRKETQAGLGGILGDPSIDSGADRGDTLNLSNGGLALMDLVRTGNFNICDTANLVL